MSRGDTEQPKRRQGKLRVGVVGTGNVARRNYIPFLADQEDVSLAYFNRTLAKAEAVAGELGGRVFESAEALMQWDPDTVFLLTGEMDRYAAAEAVLDHGPRRLFFEKPLVARHGQAHVCEEDFLDGRRLLGRAIAADCETAMIFNYRFLGQSLLAKKLVGAVTSVMGLVHYACWSHCIDLVHHFAGPLAEVTALRSEQTRGAGSAEAEDVTVAFRTEADAAGTLIGTSALHWDFPLFEMFLSFEQGRIHFRGLDAEMEVLDHRQGRREAYAVPRDRSRWDQYDTSFGRSIGAYLDSIRQHRPPPVPGLAGLQELQVEAGIRRSIAMGRPIRLGDEFPIG